MPCGFVSIYQRHIPEDGKPEVPKCFENLGETTNFQATAS